MKIIIQKVWTVENYRYLCSVLSLLTAPKNTKKGREKQTFKIKEYERESFRQGQH